MNRKHVKKMQKLTDKSCDSLLKAVKSVDRGGSGWAGSIAGKDCSPCNKIFKGKALQVKRFATEFAFLWTTTRLCIS
jgi:hypothetical protein